MNKQTFLMIECSDYNTIYKVLLFDENINKKEIQNKIYEIKNHFYNEDFDNWTIDNVLEELSKYFNFEDLGDPSYLEV